MKKIIKKWGDGNGIYLDREDCKIYELGEGDFVDLEIVKIKNDRKKTISKEM